MWSRIREIIRKEFYQALREPRMRVVLFIPPVLQLLVFGYAVNLDVEHGRIAWVDLDRTPASRELKSRFEGSRYFEIAALPAQESDVRDLMDRGRVQAVIRVQPGFGRDIERGDPTAVQVLIEGSNSNTASIVSNYASQIIARYARGVMAAQQRRRLVSGAGEVVDVELPGLNARSRVWFNPELRSRDYFVPGVVANIITLITLMLTAMAIVREKELGTMEQLMVTPIRPIELMLGKTLPFAVVGIVQVALATATALLVFKVPFRGSVLLLFVCALLYLLTTLGTGLFISTISQTQQQAMMATFFFFMPAFMLSGFAFPIHNMPPAIQLLTYLNPVRYFVEIVRGIFLKGVGPNIIWPQMTALLVFGVAIVLISALRFRKRLD